MIRKLFGAWFGAAAPTIVAAAGMATPATGDVALDWISTTKAQSGIWKNLGELDLPSGQIFVGDTSWGDDYHMTGASDVAVSKLTVWALVETSERQVHALWLAAGPAVSPPETITHELSFGMDSAYFVVGDAAVGAAIAGLRDRPEQIPGAEDGFELFLPIIQADGFVTSWVPVPPDAGRALAINTNNDGALKAVWTKGEGADFLGILIDITGQAPDGAFLDLLLNSELQE